MTDFNDCTGDILKRQIHPQHNVTAARLVSRFPVVQVTDLANRLLSRVTDDGAQCDTDDACIQAMCPGNAVCIYCGM